MRQVGSTTLSKSSMKIISNQIPTDESGEYIECLAATPGKSLKTNFSWTMMGNTVYVGTQWGILVLLARLGNPEAVGQFSLGLAVTAPVMLLASLQLRAVQATDAKLQFHFGDYAGLRIIMTALAALVICIISGALYRGATAATIAAFALSKGIESFSDVFYGQWQQRERMDLIAKSLMLRGGLGLTAVAVSFAIFHTIWGVVCFMSAAWAVVFVFFDLPHGIGIARQMRQSIMPRFSAIRMKQLFRISLPLGIVTMLISFNSNVPRYMISHFRGERELGIFSALSYILLGGTMIVNALGQSATPRLAVYAAQGKAREFSQLLYRLLLIGVALGACGLLVALVAGRQIISLIYGQEYAQSHELLPWLMVAAAFGYLSSFSGYGLTAARHFKVQVPLFSIITVLTLALCYFLVQMNGSVGAAKALTVASLVQMTAIIVILLFSKPIRVGNIEQVETVLIA